MMKETPRLRKFRKRTGVGTPIPVPTFHPPAVGNRLPRPFATTLLEDITLFRQNVTISFKTLMEKTYAERQSERNGSIPGVYETR
jgi:hypothetical protein